MRYPGVLVILVAGALASTAQAADSGKAAAGERVARSACGGCHATAQGASPLADAPPFRELYRRYPPGGLEQLLQEGMLPPDRPQEEGSGVRHPRMPQVALDVDEVASLKAYLTSLEPRRP